MNLNSRQAITIGAIVTSVVLIAAATFFGSRSTGAITSANSETNKKTFKNVEEKDGANVEDQKLKIKSKMYKKCGNDLTSECGAVDLKISGIQGDKWHRLFFVIDPILHAEIDSKIENIKGQEAPFKALKPYDFKNQDAKVNKRILNRGFLDFYNDLPLKDQQNLKKKTFFFSIPEDSENFENIKFEKSVNFDINGVDKTKKEEVYQWQYLDNLNTIKVELFGDRGEEKALLGLDIKFYNPNHPTSDLPLRNTVYKGMHVQYNYNVQKDQNIINVLDVIKLHGSKAEWLRLNGKSFNSNNLFFNVYIVASPEQRKELLEMVDVIKIDNEFKNVFSCGSRNNKACGVFNLKVKDESDIKNYRIALAFERVKYDKFETAYLEKKGTLSRAEFSELFPDQEETQIGETTYITPQVAGETDQKQSIVKKMLEISKLGDFKSYVDGFDKNDMDFWNDMDIYLIMPSDCEHENIVSLHPNYSIINIAMRYPDSTKNLPVSVKYLNEETYKKEYGVLTKTYDYKARVIGIENVFKSGHFGLMIEMSYIERLLTETKNKNGIFADSRTFFENGFKYVIASYKGMLLYYDYAYYDRNVIKILNAIETDQEKGLENEFNKQYDELYRGKGYFPSFKVLLIGKVDDIKAFAKTIGVQDEKWDSETK